MLPSNIPKSKRYYYYINSGAGRYLSEYKISFISFTKLNRLITIIDFIKQRIVILKETIKINISIKGKP